MMSGPKSCVVLPAAGVGSRMGVDVPKQFCEIVGRPLISYTIQCFERLPWISDIIIIVSTDYLEHMQNIVEQFKHSRVTVVEGAQTRHRSIYNGVKAIAKVCRDVEVVIVHDAARPLVSAETVTSVANAAATCGAAGVVRPLVSTVVALDGNGFMDHALERCKYRASEMPQAFQYDVIKLAYDKATDYDLDYGTECLHLAQQYAAVKVRLLDGPDNLWKVTHRKDIHAFEGLLKESICHVNVIFKSGVQCPSLLQTIRQSFLDHLHQAVRVRSGVNAAELSMSCSCTTASPSLPSSPSPSPASVSVTVLVYDDIYQLSSLSPSDLLDTVTRPGPTQSDPADQGHLVVVVGLQSTAAFSPSYLHLMASVNQLARRLPHSVLLYALLVNREDEEMLRKASDIVASLATSRNRALTGQIFSCL